MELALNAIGRMARGHNSLQSPLGLRAAFAGRAGFPGILVHCYLDRRGVAEVA
jgi:hypothetical protein